MNNQAKENLKLKLEKKKEIEKLSNKSLLIFTVALFFEVVLIFMYSALKNSYNYNISRGIGITGFIFLIAFVVLLIIGKKRDDKTLKNLSYTSLAVSLSLIFISLNVIIADIIRLFGKEETADFFNAKIGHFTGDKGVLFIMIALASYVVISFIYYNIKINQIKKNK